MDTVKAVDLEVELAEAIIQALWMQGLISFDERNEAQQIAKDALNAA
jgi:hypothetical protein